MQPRNVPDTDTQPTPPPLDREQVDGKAGRGDMLGGLTTGAGSRLGVPDDGSPGPGGVMTIPMPPNQHDLDDVDDVTGPARSRRRASVG